MRGAPDTIPLTQPKQQQQAARLSMERGDVAEDAFVDAGPRTVRGSAGEGAAAAEAPLTTNSRGEHQPATSFGLSEKFSILLVEDDAVTLKHVEAMLKRYGNYNVKTAVNGRIALEMLAESRAAGSLPDLILTDLRMPEVSGFDLIGAVSDVPIVVMSCHDSQDNVMQAFEVGRWASI